MLPTYDITTRRWSRRLNNEELLSFWNGDAFATTETKTPFLDREAPSVVARPEVNLAMDALPFWTNAVVMSELSKSTTIRLETVPMAAWADAVLDASVRGRFSARNALLIATNAVDRLTVPRLVDAYTTGWEVDVFSRIEHLIKKSAFSDRLQHADVTRIREKVRKSRR